MFIDLILCGPIFMKMIRCVALKVILVAIVFACLSMIGGGKANSKHEEVNFILPTGFRGCFKVVSGGPNPPYEKGLYKVQVPKTAVVRIATLRILNEWHTETAVFENGDHIPIESEQNEIGFYLLFSFKKDGNEEVWYFIGPSKKRPASALDCSLGEVCTNL